MEQIKKAIRKFLWWMKFLFWDKPTSKPQREAPIRVKGEQVFDEYMVLTYHKQRINVHKSEYEIWKLSSRADKRATAQRYKTLEKKGLIRFEEINGKLICLKNKNYQELAAQAKEKK